MYHLVVGDGRYVSIKSSMVELTREVEWFLRTLQKEFDIEVSTEDVMVEAVE